MNPLIPSKSKEVPFKEKKNENLNPILKREPIYTFNKNSENLSLATLTVSTSCIMVDISLEELTQQMHLFSIKG